MLKEEIRNTNLIIESSSNYLQINVESITTEEYKSLPHPIAIQYGFSESSFGKFFVATTPKGICSLQFADDSKSFIDEFIREWENSVITRDDSVAEEISEVIFKTDAATKLNLFVKGTAFQLRVWQALLSIPFGSVISYKGVAKLANCESGVRATASAIARNPIGYLIPCHRVIRNDGVIGEYRWGSERKKSMVIWEEVNVNKQEHLKATPHAPLK